MYLTNPIIFERIHDYKVLHYLHCITCIEVYVLNKGLVFILTRPSRRHQLGCLETVTRLALQRFLKHRDHVLLKDDQFDELYVLRLLIISKCFNGIHQCSGALLGATAKVSWIRK